MELLLKLLPHETLTTFICNPSRLCGIHPACLQAVLQKHLYILMLHLFVFLAFASYPCTKWQDLLPEVERPGSSGLACVQQILCFTGDKLMGVVRVVLWVCSWYGSLDVSPCCRMNPDMCMPNVPVCSTSYWGFDCTLSLTFLFIPFESEAQPICRTTCWSQPSWPFRGEGADLANEILAAIGFFCSLALLYKSLAKASQGSS